MEKFTAETFFRIGESMEKLRADWAGPDSTHDHTKVYDVALLELFVDACQKIGLTVSCEQMKKLARDLTENNTRYTSGEIANRFHFIFETIVIEMEQNVFMYIPQARSARYGIDSPFGAAVAKQFPSASFDTREAGNCFAAGRYTACVFHLMRGLEVALTAFAAIFHVPSDHTNWHNIIEGLESKIRDMGKDPNKAADWKMKQEFYSQAASSFMFFKEAWRNYTAHARGKYTEEEADAIYRNVGAFMAKIADGGIAE